MSDRQAIFQAIEEACRPVRDLYGLQVVARTETRLSDQVWLRNGTVGLRALVDWGECNPMIYVYRLDPSVGNRIEDGEPEWSRAENYEISAFMSLEDPNLVANIRPPLATREPAEVRSELSRYVAILGRVAEPALHGNFRQFSALKVIIDENARRIREQS